MYWLLKIDYKSLISKALSNTYPMCSLMQIQEMKQTEKKKQQQTTTQCEQQQKQ